MEPSHKIDMWIPRMENREKLQLEDARFIFDQAEKLLSDTLETAKLVADRSHSLLAILITSLTGLVGFTVSEIENRALTDPLSITLIAVSIYLFALMLFLKDNIRPAEYYVLGSAPKKIFIDNFFTPAVPDGQRIIRLLDFEISRYQVKIDDNLLMNQTRWGIYKNSLILTACTPVIFLGFYLIILFFQTI